MDMTSFLKFISVAFLLILVLALNEENAELRSENRKQKTELKHYRVKLKTSERENNRLQYELDNYIDNTEAISIIRELEIDEYKSQQEIERLNNEISELNRELKNEYLRLQAKFENQ